MLYGDERLIARRLEKQKQHKQSIGNDMVIDGIAYQFARREFEFGFTMVVPKSFDNMPRELAKKKFPYEDRPPIIISSGDCRICLAYHHDKLTGEGMQERLRNYRNFIKRLHPTNVFFSENITDASGDLKIACYDYRYTVIDNDVYNLSFFTDLQDRELLGWFICPVEQQEAWEPLARQMIKTIEVARGDCYV